MTNRAAPGLIAGGIALVLAVLGMVTGQVWLTGLAGLFGLGAGLFTLVLSNRVSTAQAEVEDAVHRADDADADRKVMAARAARFEAEALLARSHLAEATAPQPPSAIDLAKVTDPDTGLFNTAFFAVTLENRVSAARRGLRPLALALLEPVTGLSDNAPRPAITRAVADSVLHTLRDSDLACRLEGGLMGLILEDTPENGAVWTVERVRRRLAADTEDLALRAGVACYPAHAFDADQLLEAANGALRSARDWRQDRIEVASVPDD